MNVVKSILGVSVCAGIVFVLGCVSLCTDSIMESHGYKKATRDEMMQPLKPSFAVPPVRTALAPFSKEKIIGQWSGSFVSDTCSNLLSLGYSGPCITMFSHQKFFFFEDGTFKSIVTISGKETSCNGDWDYQDGVLTMSQADSNGKSVTMDMIVLWYSSDDFELRYADVGAYENLLHATPEIKSVACRYEPTGLFHTQMVMSSGGNESVTNMVQGPQLLSRERDQNE